MLKGTKEIKYIDKKQASKKVKTYLRKKPNKTRNIK